MTRNYDHDVDHPPTHVEGATWVPWAKDGMVGYRIEVHEGPDQYLYFNPSSDGGGDPTWTPDAFVYHGNHGDPAKDLPCHFYTIEPQGEIDS